MKPLVFVLLCSQFILISSYRLQAQVEGATVFSSVFIHSDADVGVFVDLANVEDTLVHLGSMALIESSLNNQKSFTGSGTLKVSAKGYEQDLYGGASIYLDTLILDNQSVGGVAFDCDIFIDRVCDFRNGVLEDFELEDEVDPETLHFVQFSENASVINTRNASHICGVVKKVGTTAFNFPIGDRGYYRPALVAASDEVRTHTTKYYCCPNPFDEESIPSDCFIQREEYWYISSLDEECVFALSYSTQTSQFDCDEVEVGIVGYDGFLDNTMNLLKSSETKELESSFRYFWTTSVNDNNKNLLLDERFRWYSFGGNHNELPVEWPQIVTPNDDGYNDEFNVPNIADYDNNKIKIFNRYGNLVYETSSYQNDWRGQTSVSVVGSSIDGLLPSATYFVFFYNDDKLIYKDYIELVHNK